MRTLASVLAAARPFRDGPPFTSRVIEYDVIFTNRTRLWSDGCRTGVDATDADHERFHVQIDAYDAHRKALR